MRDLDQQIWEIQKSTRTLFPVFLGLHNFLRTKLPWYSSWHLSKHFKQVHYGSLGIYSILVIALAVWVGIFQPLSVSASTNTKVWNTKTDFESGTISNLDKDTNSGHLTLPSTTNTVTEDFTTDTKYNSGSSSQVDWNTTTNKLTLEGAGEGIVSDMTSKLSEAWGAGETIQASVYDSANNFVYIGGSQGSFIAFNNSTQAVVDLTAKIYGDWSSSSIKSIAFDSTNGKVYLGGASGKFGVFTGGSDPANGTWVYLNSKISADWSTGSINSLTFDSTNGKVYIGGDSGKFGVFTGGSDPANGTWVYLYSKVSSDLAGSYIYALTFDSTNAKVYLGGQNGKFGVFTGGSDPANGTWVYLTSKISSNWSTNTINALTFDSTNSRVYLGGDQARFGAFTGGSDPANGTFVYLNSKISSIVQWSSSQIYYLTFDSTNNKIYLGGFSGKFGAFTGGSDPANGTFVYLNSKITADWSTNIIYTLSFDSTNGRVYLGGDSGRLGTFTGGSNPASGTWVNLTSSVSTYLKAPSISAMEIDGTNNIIYLGGKGGRLAAYIVSSDTMVSLTSKISSNWSTSTIYALSFDSTNNIMYIGGGSGKFGAFAGGSDPANGTWTYLSTKISGDWSSWDLYDLTFDSTNAKIYLGGAQARFGVFTGSADPANGTWVNLNSKISANWSTSDVTAITFDSTYGKIYLGGSGSRFGAFTGGSDPANGTWVYLYAKISGIFGGSAVFKALAFDSANGLVYLGGVGFASFSGGADPANGTATNLYSKISSFWNSQTVNSFTMYGSNLFLAGGGYGGGNIPKLAKYNGSTATDLSAALSAGCTNFNSNYSYPYSNSLVQIENVTYIGGYIAGVFAKYELGYKNPGYAVTNTLDSVSNNIMSATLSATETKPSGTVITYQLSGDGGSHWEDASLDTLHSFTNAGSDLRIKMSLSTTDTAVTPEITALSLSYTSLNNYSGSINLIHDGTREVNFYSLSQSATVPTGSTLTYKVRTAATQVALSSAAWGGSIASTSLPYSLTSVTTDNQFIEIQADFVSSDGLVSPDLDSLTLDYIDNDIPLIQSLSASYATDGSNNLSLSYQIKDTDTDTNPSNPNQASISFQYSLDSGNVGTYHDFTDSAISGTKGLTSISKSSYATKSTIINLSTDLANQYSNTFVIKVIINDNELARNTANTTSSAMEIDTKAPSAASFKINGGSSETNTINLSSITATDDTTLTQMIISTNASFTGANYQAYSQTVSNFSATSGDTIYIKITDAYGNQSTAVNNKVPVAVQNVIIQDLSNTSSANYRLVVGWDAQNIAEVSGYRIYRKVDNGGYAEIASVPGASVNLYGDPDVDPNHTYSYKVYCTDSATNIGVESTIVSAKPAFTPTISNVSVSAAGSDRATITWTTDVACDSFVEFGIDTSYGAIQGTSDLSTSHSLIVTGLNPQTTFHYRVRSRDQKGTLAVTTDGNFTTNAAEAEIKDETREIASIENVKTSDIDFDSVDVLWETKIVTVSKVIYGEGDDLSAAIEDQSPNNYTTQHKIKIENLEQGKTYKYRVIGQDLLGNKYASDNYSFTTLSKPSMSNVSGVSTGSYSATVTWKTNTDTNSFVVYGVSSDKLSESFGTDDVYSIDHTVALSNLTPATTYYYRAKSTDKYGNSAYSDTKSFSTTIDTKAPEISNLRSETYLVTDESGNSKVQAIISWNTDEPSSSLIKYSEGVAASNAYTNSSPDDPALTTSHVVILASLKPSTTYHIIAISKDSSGNTATSNDYTVLTKRQEKSITQIIVQILEENFSWLKKLKIL